LPCEDEVATYNKELARKIVRLLESDHAGEVTAAVRKLAGMARGQGHNLDEMLAAIYGSPAPKASSGSSPFTAWDAAETLRKARAKAATDAFRQAYPDTSGFWDGADYAADFAKPKASPHRFKTGRLIDLQSMVVEYGTDPLSPWETEFVNDILDRQSDVLSDKQAEVIDKILAKYQKFSARNGDEKSFWGA
jgi:hypothetical protein